LISVVTGGNGIDRGSAGAGGRIAIEAEAERHWQGNAYAYGGFGGLASINGSFVPGVNGAAGTIFYSDNNGVDVASRPPIFVNGKIVGYRARDTILILDNDNRNPYIPTFIMDEAGGFFEFQEVHLFNHVTLHMENLSSVSVFHKFDGDRTGRVHLRGNQTMLVEVVEGLSTESIAPVSYRVDPDAEAFFPTTTTLLGTRTYFEGSMLNVLNFRAAKGSRVTFTNHSRTGMPNGDPLSFTYKWVTQKGNLTFGTVTLQNGCVLDLYQIPDDMVVKSSLFNLKYHALMLMNRGYILTSQTIIESRGVLNLNYTGFGSGMGPGAGVTFVDKRNQTRGSGAGHGGQGGGDYKLGEEDRILDIPGYPGLPGKRIQGNGTGGPGHGSVVYPLHLGSGGGAGPDAGSRGGHGGGYLRLEALLYAHVDGMIFAAGEAGVGNHSGGGSGIEMCIVTPHDCDSDFLCRWFYQH
jgi:hypothetical protein